MARAEDVIRVAASQIGTIETPNNRTKYGVWFGMDGVPWCDLFQSWDFDQAAALPICPGKNSYTVSHAAKFQKAGRWGKEPRVGALVFFKFPGGPNRIHHVGIVTAIGPGWIETIEGNTSRGTGGSQRDGGGVWRRRRSSGIVGYGYPAYDESPAPTPPPPVGGETERIRDLQRRLGIRDDGDFGPITAGRCNKRVIGWQQEVNRKNRSRPHMENDGPLVAFLKQQANRRWSSGLNPANTTVGPGVNSVIVNLLHQADSICGANGYRGLCR